MRWRRSRRPIAPTCSLASRAVPSSPAVMPAACCASPPWRYVSMSSAPSFASDAPSTSNTCSRCCCRSSRQTCWIASSRERSGYKATQARSGSAQKELSSGDDNSSALRFKPLARLKREQGLAIASVKLAENGAVVDLKFHSKTDAARTLLATLGIKEGDENSGLALVELGTRLGAALARANGKVIEADRSAPPLTPRADQTARTCAVSRANADDQDDIVSGEIEA